MVERDDLINQAKALEARCFALRTLLADAYLTPASAARCLLRLGNLTSAVVRLLEDCNGQIAPTKKASRT